MTATTADTPKKKHSFRDVLAALGRPKVASMLALGIASGLPFLLTGATFGYWLGEEGTTLTAIGFLSWVGLAYTFKVFWAPAVDRIKLPILGGLGQRRSWVIFAQLLVGIGLVAMAVFGVHGPGGLATIGAFALLVAFASATQDIAVDAWRIESAPDVEEQSLVTSAFQ
jgi:PAT family beta-lactamase induction signal transducer AmpG